jgi:hypothetical protein
VLPLQQPLGHDVASHTHCPPPLQPCPDAHAAQAAPPLPHELLDSLLSDSQLPPLQQPGHDIPPQEHAPPAQACPEAQALHAAPPTPQSAEPCMDWGTQVLPLQQPVGHDDASQTHLPVVESHSCPATHAAHVAPPVPHDAVDSRAYASHVPVGPPLQQPLGQVLVSHVHCPLVVSQTPFMHGLHVAPTAPHSDADWAV